MLNSATGGQPAEVTRVICASVSRVQGSVMSELFQIRNRLCELSGPEFTVRGALLYSSGWFVLWLEGAPAGVEAFVQRAARDPRNAHQKIIHRSRGPASLPEGLSVTVTQGADSPSDFAGRVMQALEKFKQGTHSHPAAVWQRLSAPCSIRTGRGDYRQLPDRHVAFVAAHESHPIDVLRKLGDRFGSKVVYQRFASAKSHSSDVGAAYVDLPCAGHVRRVQLLSRRALAQHTVRQSLSRLDGLVLLLSSRPSAAVELAASVAACVRTLPSPPPIYLVNGGDGIASSVAGLLRQAAPGARSPAVFELPESQFTDLLVHGDPRHECEPEHDLLAA